MVWSVPPPTFPPPSSQWFTSFTKLSCGPHCLCRHSSLSHPLPPHPQHTHTPPTPLQRLRLYVVKLKQTLLCSVSTRAYRVNNNPRCIQSTKWHVVYVHVLGACRSVLIQHHGLSLLRTKLFPRSKETGAADTVSCEFSAIRTALYWEWELAGTDCYPENLFGRGCRHHTRLVFRWLHTFSPDLTAWELKYNMVVLSGKTVFCYLLKQVFLDLRNCFKRISGNAWFEPAFLVAEMLVKFWELGYSLDTTLFWLLNIFPEWVIDYRP